ncbi:hypothetical protein ACFVTM_18570 [Arthrobacter sp. NPDC058130]|uniref:hypothetical protein n=1 Tax=Arthrobacter sp. NPDC058130 TaxID=3346353 RepID=UPI0036E22702
MATGVSVTSLSVLDGQLGAGVKGPGKSVLINLADHSKYTIIPKTAVMFRQLGNQVFFVKEPGVWSYNTTTKKMTQILTEDVGAMWGLDVSWGAHRIASSQSAAEGPAPSGLPAAAISPRRALSAGT